MNLKTGKLDGVGRDAAVPDFIFGRFRLQPSRTRLLEDDRAVPIGSRAFHALEILVLARERTVSKYELLERVWHGRAVGDNNLTVTVSALRRVLHDDGDPPIIATVAGQGYRFVAPVNVSTISVGRLAEVPSIAVLPYRTEGADGDHDLLGLGIAEAIITALASNRWLAVIAHDSSARVLPDACPRDVARQLGVRYVISGTVHLSGNGVRVATHLADAAANTDLAQADYDHERADIFAIRDEVVALIVATVRPALIEAEERRGILKPPGNIDAWSACQRGAWHLARFGRPELLDARTWFKRAVELDPSFAPGFHGLALAYLFEGSGWLPSADPHWQARGESLALQAVVLDDRDSGAHAVLGFARMLRGDHRGSLAALDIAVNLNPNDATAHAMRGATLTFKGRHREGLHALETSFKLSPNDPRLRIRQTHAVLAHFFSRNYSAAETLARAIVAEWPDWPAGHRMLCYVLVETGRIEEARAALAAAKALEPGLFERFSHDRMPWYRPVDFNRVAAALHVVEG